MASEALNPGQKIQRTDSSDEAEVKTNTDGASTACTAALAAAGATLRHVITDVTISNSSSTNVTVDIRDGAAGSVLWTFPVPANGGVVHQFKTPLRFSLNTAVAFDASAGATTITFCASGFKSDR